MERLMSQKTTHTLLPYKSNEEIDTSFNKDDVSSGQNNEQSAHIPPKGRGLDSNMDPKKLKRVTASRQYSQKYRLKQLHYILQLETEMKALQAEVAINSPRIKYIDRQNSLLRIENGSMKQRISAFSSELMFKEAQYEELKNEREILKQLHMVKQQLPAELFKTTPGGNNYPSLSMSMNHSAFNPFTEAGTAAGIPRIMINQRGTEQTMNRDSSNFN